MAPTYDMNLLRSLRIPVLISVLAFAWIGCADLMVENDNSPDNSQVLADPDDVVNLVGSSFADFWRANVGANGQMPLTAIADELSYSWGNFAGRYLSSEPRVAFDNSPTFAYAAAMKAPWDNNYLAISNTSDALAIINADESAFEDAAKLKAFALFIQGLSHGYVALRYDQGFTVDEHADLTALALKPYPEVMAFALQKLEASIEIAQANEFTIPAADDWIFGLTVTNEDLERLAHSFMARFIASVGRWPTERASADWEAIIRHAEQGITEDWAPIGNDSGTLEWDPSKAWGQEGRSWSRADYHTIGPADASGGFQQWLDTPVAERNVFDIHTADRRIVGPQNGMETIVAGEQRDRAGAHVAGTVLTYPRNSGTDFEYWGVTGPFPPNRGTYHFSSHTHKRYRAYLDTGNNGPMVQFKVTELDMLIAEGLLRTGGSAARVADLINKTRVERGHMNPASASDPVGSPDDAQSPADDASLWAKLKHEKNIECYLAAAGRAYFDKRGWGDLTSGTPVHFAVPGEELEVLEMPIYTLGGIDGEDAAPKTGRFPTRAGQERNDRRR